MKNRADIFAELGARLASFGDDARSREAVRCAMADNAWFTEEDIRRAVGAICACMLDAGRIGEWLAHYPALAEVSRPRRVAVIMAGNIPLVGFFDLMCVAVSGNVPVVKYSAKDRALMEYIVEILGGIEPEMAIEEYREGECVDAVIATGGESANLWFESTFGGVPHLFRGSRHSVAVLSGNETDAETEALADDIFSYAGLGCRNVSLIFAPEGYNLHLPARNMCDGYYHNYLRTKALLTMSGKRFTDTGTAVVVEGGAEFPSALSRINVVRYSSSDEVAGWLAAHDGELQCVVSDLRLHPRTVGFGKAQYPELHDYADDVDVMGFLLSL